MMEADGTPQRKVDNFVAKDEATKQRELRRLIAHLGRTFSRRYDIQVLPSGQKGIWACGLDPKISSEIDKYMIGQKDSLDDLPAEAFTPVRMLYDEESAKEMPMDKILTLLHHEAGHVKFSDFRLLIEGQKQAKEEGYLPTSFWLVLEGIEDPRVNVLEGEESSVIDRQIRSNQGRDLQERITESPLTERPLMLQFAYNSFNYWLHGEGISELQETEVGKLGEVAKPLLLEYFENADLTRRTQLQEQIWNIAKQLERKEIEKEEMRQMAQKMQGQEDGEKSSPSGEGESTGGQGNGSEQQIEDNKLGTPSGKQHGANSKSSDETDGGSGADTVDDEVNKNDNADRKSLMDKIRESIFGKKTPDKDTNSRSEENTRLGEQNEVKKQEQGGKERESENPEKVDLSKLTSADIEKIKEAIDKLPQEEREELAKKSREIVDQVQKEAVQDGIPKSLKLEKNPKTGEYEAKPWTMDEKQIQKAQAEYEQAVQHVEGEEKAEQERQEAERKQQEEARQREEAERREKLEMQQAGFSEDERNKYLQYRELEDSMYSKVRNFQRAMKELMPRRKESVYEGGYFSGAKFNRRDLVRKAPVGDERFHMRQVERPVGEPRLFVGLLVDNSGSMNGKKMHEARKTMVFFAQVCEQLGIPFMATSFGNNAEIIKTFRQDFSNPVERIKPKIIDATNASGGQTDLHMGLMVTIEAMNEERRRLNDSHGLVFVITDGEANAGLTGPALKQYIEENRGRLTFKGFGLTYGDVAREQVKSSLDTYFGESNCAYPRSFEELPDEAFRMLRTNLVQFRKYFN